MKARCTFSIIAIIALAAGPLSAQGAGGSTTHPGLTRGTLGYLYLDIVQTSANCQGRLARLDMLSYKTKAAELSREVSKVRAVCSSVSEKRDEFLKALAAHPDLPKSLVEAGKTCMDKLAYSNDLVLSGLSDFKKGLSGDSVRYFSEAYSALSEVKAKEEELHNIEFDFANRLVPFKDQPNDR
jgi:hypothetical protein